MLYVLLGSSGSGKTTLGELIFGRSNELVSFTTRKKRDSEIDGVDYHFIDVETFKQHLKEGKLAEHSEYAGNYYGLTINEIETKTNLGDCYAVLDFHGYKQLKEQVKDTTSIFVSVDKEILKERLQDRGESDDFISKRLALFEQEEMLKHSVDLVISNNTTLEIATDQFLTYLKPNFIKSLESFL